MKINQLAAVALLLGGSVTFAQAAVISWGSATALSAITGNSSQVSTNGTVHHAANGITNGRVMTFGDGLGNTVDLNGQFAIGTFTASGTTQDLTALANGFGQAHINAFQVRAVPEPSSAALLGLAGFALILRRRK